MGWGLPGFVGRCRNVVGQGCYHNQRCFQPPPFSAGQEHLQGGPGGYLGVLQRALVIVVGLSWSRAVIEANASLDQRQGYPQVSSHSPLALPPLPPSPPTLQGAGGGPHNGLHGTLQVPRAGPPVHRGQRSRVSGWECCSCSRYSCRCSCCRYSVKLQSPPSWLEEQLNAAASGGDMLLFMCECERSACRAAHTCC